MCSKQQEKEEEMHDLVMLVQAATGLGVLPTGFAAPCFGSVYQEKNK